MWKMSDRKQCKWKNMSGQGWEDICTANFNYEHFPLFLSSLHSNWPTGLGKEGATGETDGKKKREHFWNYTERQNRQSKWTEQVRQRQTLKTKQSLGRIYTCLLRLSSSFSLFSHLVFLHSFFPMLSASLNPLVAPVFHFKLDYWDLNGCWAKFYTKKQRETEGNRSFTKGDRRSVKENLEEDRWNEKEKNRNKTQNWRGREKREVSWGKEGHK